MALEAGSLDEPSMSLNAFPDTRPVLQFLYPFWLKCEVAFS